MTKMDLKGLPTTINANQTFAGDITILGDLSLGDTSADIFTITSPAISTNQTSTLIVQNTTAAAASAQQYSPMLTLIGQGWKTDATAASQQVDMALQCQPVEGASAPTGLLRFFSRINVGSWVECGYITSAGVWSNNVGIIYADRTSVGTGQTIGMQCRNLTAATDGAQQYSTMLNISGYGWKTDATAASQMVEFAWQTQPVQGTSAPTGNLALYFRINGSGGSWTKRMQFGTSGTNIFYLNGVGTNQYQSITLSNDTAATAGAQQYSPALSLLGRGWKTDATAGSQTVSFLMQVVPIQGAANPTGDLIFMSNVNAAGWVSSFSIDTAGGVNYKVKGAPIYRTMKNNSGGAMAAGDVVILDTSDSTGASVTNTTTANDPLVFGVITTGAADQADVVVCVSGYCGDVVKVNGTTNIAVGDPLATFNAIGIAAKGTWAGGGIFAIALEAYATDDSAGVIKAWIL